MIVTNLIKYDLTGADPLYKRVNRRFMVFTAGQKIDLEEAAYPNTITVRKLNNGTWETLSRGTEWETKDECIDNGAISRAKVRYTGEGVWDYSLVNSFFMKDLTTPTPEYEICVEYQALEKDIAQYYRDCLGPEYSPGLMRTVLNKLEELVSIKNPVKDYSAETVADMRCMPEDLTGRAATNFVENEEHRVNTASTEGVCIIRPQNGSFYNKDVVVRYQPQNTTAWSTLRSGIDYEVVGINHEKTAISIPSEGVYEYIVIKLPVTGSVFISYRAFGGEVSQADINTIKEVVRNIYQTLEDTSLLTTTNLHDAELIKNINYRLSLIEETIKHYQSQLFKYVPSVTDKWADIAFIPHNVWSEEAGVPETAFGEFRIEIEKLEYYLDVRVSYDTVEEDLKVTVFHVDAPTYELDGVNYFAKRIMPKFRLVWNAKVAGDQEGSIEHGVMLQATFNGTTTAERIVKVTDRTGANSHWTLIDSQGATRPSGTPNSDICVFPNNAIWNSADGGLSTSDTPVCNEGYTVMVGAIDVVDIERASSTEFEVDYNDPETGNIPQESTGYTSITPIISGWDIECEHVSAVRFKLYDRVAGIYRYGETRDVNKTKNSIHAAAMYFYDDLCVIDMTLNRGSNSYSMIVKSHTGTNSLRSNRFVLSQIDIVC